MDTRTATTLTQQKAALDVELALEQLQLEQRLSTLSMAVAASPSHQQAPALLVTLHTTLQSLAPTIRDTGIGQQSILGGETVAELLGWLLGANSPAPLPVPAAG